MDTQDQEWRRRIETKLDTVSDAIVSLARMEERMVTLFNRMDTYDQRQTQMGDRVGQIYDRLIDLEKSSLKVKAMERVMWIVATAAVSSLFWFIQQN
ncbi:MAG: hypothetical protein RLZZ602_1590 [Pseudomonadota bacterium]|jgi:hypothetical protein